MNYKLISCDDHLDLTYLPKDVWTKRLPSKIRNALRTSRSARDAGCGSAKKALGQLVWDER